MRPWICNISISFSAGQLRVYTWKPEGDYGDYVTLLVVRVLCVNDTLGLSSSADISLSLRIKEFPLLARCVEIWIF